MTQITILVERVIKSSAWYINVNANGKSWDFLNQYYVWRNISIGITFKIVGPPEVRGSILLSQKNLVLDFIL